VAQFKTTIFGSIYHDHLQGWLAAFLSKIAFEKRIKKLSVVKKVSLTKLED